MEQDRKDSHPVTMPNEVRIENNYGNIVIGENNGTQQAGSKDITKQLIDLLVMQQELTKDHLQIISQQQETLQRLTAALEEINKRINEFNN